MGHTGFLSLGNLGLREDELDRTEIQHSRALKEKVDPGPSQANSREEHVGRRGRPGRRVMVTQWEKTLLSLFTTGNETHPKIPGRNMPFQQQSKSFS